MMFDELSSEQLKKKKKELEYEVSKYEAEQYVIKLLSNAAFGFAGCEYGRFYDIRLAESITLSGRLVIQWVAKRVNDYLNKLANTEQNQYLIMMDTDSCFFSLENIVKKFLSPEQQSDKDTCVKFIQTFCSNVIQKKIDEAFKDYCKSFNTFDQTLEMKLEGIMDKLIIRTKKNYVANILVDEAKVLNEPKMKIMGLEAIRSSTPELCRKLIKEAIWIILNKEEADVQKHIEKIESEFKTYKVADIAFPKTVSDLKKYADRDTLYRKGSPIQVKGSLIYNNLLKANNLLGKYDLIQEGEKIKFIYLAMPNPIGSEVIAFQTVLPAEFGLENYIDYSIQFEKVFLNPIQSILNVIGYSGKKAIENTFEFED